MIRNFNPASIRARLRDSSGDPDAGVAILMVLMAIAVVASLSVLVLGVVISQDHPTIFEKKNARAIHAAESGLDAALSRIRAAQSQPVERRSARRRPHTPALRNDHGHRRLRAG